MRYLFFMLLLFTANANAVTVIIGQSNARGIYDSGVIKNAINCSYPGEKISMFLKGGEYYSKCIKDIGNRKVDAVIFWQGESDSVSEIEAKQWKAKTLKVLRSLRKDVCNKKTKLIVVLLNNVNPDPVFPYWLTVRDSQLELKGGVKIDSGYYPFESELYANGNYYYGNIHLTKEGYKMISQDINNTIRRKK